MLELRNICKKYTTGDFTQVALDDVSVSFRDNEFVAILGPSGSGKTTLLNVIGGLDHFDSGDLIIDGVSTKEYKDRDWDTYRNNRIGFVFQSYNLIPHQTVLENVELALTISGVSRSERKKRAEEALKEVGLDEHMNKKPSQLSGGQMQRVAIARALINDPEIVLADEPTGALDSTTSVQVMDLLKDVAKDRLVIMVTHNPDLAEQYATRIVRLTDGKITDDTDPLDPASVDLREAKAVHRTKMGFGTSLGLSFRNLMTKKGRTFMTAFAGAIGIIGIAAILALANGVNDYISGIEEETLSTYPLTITSSASSLSTMLSGDTADSGEEVEVTGSDDDEEEEGDEEAEEEEESGGRDVLSTLTGEDDSVDLEDEIPRLAILSSMFSTVDSNDLVSLREYLESEDCDIYDYVNAIQYDYGISPIVYSADTSEGLVQLNPNSFTSLMQSAVSSSSIVGTMQSSYTSPFNEMIDNQELLEEEYELLVGEWADEADECMLVLNSAGSVTDYTLYSIGVLDPDDLDLMVDSLTSSSEGTTGVEVPDSSSVSFTYEDALNISFKVLCSADVYRHNTETDTWTDMSDDEDYMLDVVEDGLDLHIVGVVMANSSDSTALTEGIAYTHELTELLMERAESSEIVQEQMADPDVDVFTGSTFEELQDEAAEGMDLSDVFSVDEDALTSAFTFDESAMTIDVSGIDMSGLDLSDVSIDLSSVGTDVDYSSIFADAPSPDFSTVVDSATEYMAEESEELTEDELMYISEAGTSLMSGYLTYVSEYSSALSGITDQDSLSEALVSLLVAYLQTEDAQTILAALSEIAGPMASEAMEEALQDYVQNDLASYMSSAMTELMEELSEEISTAVTTQLSAALTSAMTEAVEDMSTSISSQLASSMENAFSVDTEAFANAITFTMDTEDLVSLMSSYADADELTYENNLATLGYAVEEEPSTIYIYPIDFEAKEVVVDIIDAYNDDMEAAGEDDKVIIYTDYVGALMSSVTDIVDTISTVLIAFVSISLVVSSIMIGVITYISVLERKKEIGILRALGASKGNVASIFNAETFIEGLISGILAILVVYIAEVPVNAAVLNAYGVENIMQLPASNAAALVLLSVVLTLISGIIPASSASRRDPVEALRSE